MNRVGARSLIRHLPNPDTEVVVGREKTRRCQCHWNGWFRYVSYCVCVCVRPYFKPILVIELSLVTSPMTFLVRDGGAEC